MASIGEFLVDRGLVSAADLATAQQLQAGANERLCTVMHRMALMQGRELAEAISQFHQVPLARPDEWPPASEFDQRIPLTFLRNSKVFPLAETDVGIVVAMADPGDTFALDAIRLATDCHVIPKVAAIEDIDAAIEQVAKNTETSSEWAVQSVDDNVSEDVEHLKDLALGTPVVRLVDKLIRDAIHSRATDVHIEPFDGRLKIRMRVDGVLRDVQSPPASMAKAIASRIKILAGLNIAERRLPQDGRAHLHMDGRQLDLRVATMPTIHGESLALRLLDNIRRVLNLSKLGYSAKDEAILRRHLTAPHGMVVVTGPTGCGKTTTLATALTILNASQRKILTIEDPIEYEIEGVNQTQAKPEIGLSFAKALRAFLRHDPDVIMVGEMRDVETAQIGVHAALTGHLVLTTLHTNGAAGAVTRLLDMGVDAYLLASSLNCVIAQRLVRRLCINCCESYAGCPEFPEAILAACELDRGAKIPLSRAKGCDHCQATGYRDRIAITEILDIDEEIRRLIKPGVPATEIEAVGCRKGMSVMIVDGLMKCCEGLTTAEEVRRQTLSLWGES